MNRELLKKFSKADRKILYEMASSTRKIKPRKPCDMKCAGAFVNLETLQIERCDTCKRFRSDDEAADFVNQVLQRTRL